MSKTVLSAGIIIREILITSETVRTNKVYPIVTDEAQTPYIVYRRIGLRGNPVKTGAGADTIQLEVLCFEADYSRSVELAESVREALENRRYETDGLRMRSCVLEDSEETWQDDAYVQRLVFNVKI